ncbi:hypothetical protein BIY22_01670 [Vibrio panuliri]|uniref:NIPSNAP domain-containing protein n=1 Tax=Vibrio panuliri TaxID=1381081 RepID=A0A1Q9HQW5_9VIBR|nr:NIPSNAP family protein [Vibrio panuliri]OLQ93226.1 hypothetical protein BIY22_01670 [Vibrio panuliri]
MKIVELREYRIKPGKTAEWLSWMREELLPYQRSKGMIIIDTYVRQNEDGSDSFIWLREFASESVRQQVYANTYDQWWVTNIRPRVFTLIEEDSISVKLLQPVEL